MFRTLRPISFKAFYNITHTPTGKNHNNYNNYNNYNNGGGVGGDDNKFLLFLLGITIYSVNKLLK